MSRGGGVEVDGAGVRVCCEACRTRWFCLRSALMAAARFWVRVRLRVGIIRVRQVLARSGGVGGGCPTGRHSAGKRPMAPG